MFITIIWIEYWQLIFSDYAAIYFIDNLMKYSLSEDEKGLNIPIKPPYKLSLPYSTSIPPPCSTSIPPPYPNTGLQLLAPSSNSMRVYPNKFIK